MRRILPFALILLAVLAPVAGQELRLGIKGGIGCAAFLGSAYSDYLEATGAGRGVFIPLGGGVFATLGLGGVFALQPELLLMTLGGAFSVSGNKAAFYDWYIAPAVLVKARLGAFNVFAGPSVLFELGRYTIGGRSGDTTEIIIKHEPNDAANVLFAAVAGFGAEYPLGRGSLTAEIRALYSFTSYHTEEVINANSLADWTPFSVMALVGYSIPIGKRR